MSFGGQPRDADGPDLRAIAWLLVAAGGLAACITLLFLGMRAVMDIGGACASGGPFVPVQPCPDGVPALMTIGVLGLFAFGGLGLWAGARVGGAWAGLPLLAWPGLFLSLGWNFLEYGIAPPGEDGGLAVGWLFCGVIFVLMGAVPLWIGISARNELREGGGGAVASRFGVPRFQGPVASTGRDARDRGGAAGGAASPGSSRASSTRRDTGSDARPRLNQTGGGAPAEPRIPGGGRDTGSDVGPDADPTGDPDFVSSLERLADLRRRGDLTDEEFEAAKARLLGGDR